MYTVQAIPAFDDNYIWCLINTDDSHCVLVDPGDSNVCLQYINEHNLHLDAVLITHHHQDHTGGLEQLIAYSKQLGHQLPVYGPQNDPIPLLTHQFKEDDQVELFNQQLTFKVIDIPGHTLGHIAFYTQSQHILFCGDTLFSGGCGRIFEGTALQMHTSLQKLSHLPETTKVYCAHEYTTANLKFALSIETNNTDLNDYYQHVVELRKQEKSTIPTTIGLEKQINPFLRSHENSVKYIAEQKSSKSLPTESAVFAIIRQLKDSF